MATILMTFGDIAVMVLRALIIIAAAVWALLGIVAWRHWHGPEAAREDDGQ